MTTDRAGLADLELVCGEIFERWDKDMRSGKLLTALSGHMPPGYDPRVDRIRTNLADHARLTEEAGQLTKADAEWHQESYDEGYREGNCDAVGAAGEFSQAFIKWATGERKLLDHQEQYTAEELFDALIGHEQELSSAADRASAQVAAQVARAEAAEAREQEAVKALELYEDALSEAEAIFGGEYADRYGTMFDLALKARDQRAASIVKGEKP